MAIMDPGLRRDDVVETSSARNVIPAQAGIQQLLDFNFWSLCDTLRVVAESL